MRETDSGYRPEGENLSLKQNAILNAILTGTGLLFPLITFPYVSRVLLPAGMGKVSFATSVISYFSMFAQLGISTYGIRAVARVRDRKEELSRVVHELLGMNLAMDLLAYLLLGIALLLVPRLAEERKLYLVLSSSILLTSLGVEWLYKGLEKYRYITIRSVAFRLVALVATFLLVRSEGDVLIYGAISIFAASASNILNVFHMGRYVSFRRPAGCDWRRHMRPVLIFFALSCAASVYTQLDSLMLGFITTDEEVGIYNAAVKVKTVLVSLVTSLGAVLLPRASYYIERGEQEAFREISEKALRFVILTASALMLYFILFARECILVLSGEAYLAAVPAMQVIMPTVLCIGLTNILGIQILVPLGREKVVLQSEIAGMIVDVVINLILIPRLWSTGAAIGTLAAEIVVLAVQVYALRREVSRVFTGYGWGRLLVAMLLGTAACFWVKLLSLSALLTLVLSAILFFLVYGLFLLWRGEEILTEIISRKWKRSM